MLRKRTLTGIHDNADMSLPYGQIAGLKSCYPAELIDSLIELK